MGVAQALLVHEGVETAHHLDGVTAPLNQADRCRLELQGQHQALVVAESPHRRSDERGPGKEVQEWAHGG